MDNYLSFSGHIHTMNKCIVLDREVTISWGPLNKKYLVARGYKFTKMGDPVVVKIEDVMPGCRTHIHVKCPGCGKERLSPVGRVIKTKNTQCSSCINKGVDRSKHDLIGKHFGRLKVIRRGDKTSHCGSYSWWCRCECGNERQFWGPDLRRGKATSCGCKMSEYVESLNGKHHDDGWKERVADKLRGESNHNWKGGISYGKYCAKFTKQFKTKVRRAFDGKCFMCGMTTEEHGTALCVHHVDYNKNSICNGKKWAFIPLCQRCHAQTSNFKFRYFNELIYYWLMNKNIHFTWDDLIGIRE